MDVRDRLPENDEAVLGDCFHEVAILVALSASWLRGVSGVMAKRCAEVRKWAGGSSGLMDQADCWVFVLCSGVSGAAEERFDQRRAAPEKGPLEFIAESGCRTRFLCLCDGVSCANSAVELRAPGGRSGLLLRMDLLELLRSRPWREES